VALQACDSAGVSTQCLLWCHRFLAAAAPRSVPERPRILRTCGSPPPRARQAPWPAAGTGAPGQGPPAARTQITGPAAEGPGPGGHHSRAGDAGTTRSSNTVLLVHQVPRTPRTPPCQSHLGQELVQRGVQQADGDGQAVHGAEDALEVLHRQRGQGRGGLHGTGAAWIRRRGLQLPTGDQLSTSALLTLRSSLRAESTWTVGAAHLRLVGLQLPQRVRGSRGAQLHSGDHAAHSSNALGGGEEHVLRAAQPNALRTSGGKQGAGDEGLGSPPRLPGGPQVAGLHAALPGLPAGRRGMHALQPDLT